MKVNCAGVSVVVELAVMVSVTAMVWLTGLGPVDAMVMAPE